MEELQERQKTEREMMMMESARDQKSGSGKSRTPATGAGTDSHVRQTHERRETSDERRATQHAPCDQSSDSGETPPRLTWMLGVQFPFLFRHRRCPLDSVRWLSNMISTASSAGDE